MKIQTLRTTVRCITYLLATGFFSAKELSAQIPRLWVDVNETSIAATRDHQPAQRYRTVAVDVNALKLLLSQAPMEFTTEARTKSIMLSLPMPDGSLSRFLIAESPMMEPGLARQVPETKTYSGQGIDDLTATTRFSWTPEGFRAIILHERGSTFIAPYSSRDAIHYITYDDEHFTPNVLGSECGVTGADRPVPTPLSPIFTTGDQLRTYRLAVAATVEYTTQYGGGNATNALNNSIIPLINAINAIYEKETTIRLTLIANELSIIYTTAPDPYTNTSQSTMLDENIANLTAAIGDANFDIGHAFGDITVGGGSFSGAGVAGLGVVCGASKARGATRMGGGTGSEIIFVSLVGHEFAHQFNAPHTFNGTTSGCGGGNRSAASAYEPGSGTTLMGYTTCGIENLQPFPLSGFPTYFHTGSLDAIITYANGAGNCATMTATGNSAPTFPALTNYTIPQQTPFTLTATATDPNGNPMTYVWEQLDAGMAAPPNTDGGFRALYRSFIPSSSGNTRTFPAMTYVLNNANVPPPTYVESSTTYTTGEALVTTDRTLNFRITARDNIAAAGGVQDAAMQVTVITTAGPFAVTNPNTNIAIGMGVTVTWNVASTNAAPVNCTNVMISLSTDGGATFPTVLAASTPNDGSQSVSLPAISTTTARVKIEGIGNIFFDVSDVNFTINPALPVQISSFTGNVINAEGHVRLQWRTISEVNNYGFYVQRRVAGSVEEWFDVPGSFTAGHGTTNEPHNYSFVDNSATAGTIQYRLKQVDLDGSLNFTEPISVSRLTSVTETAPREFALLQNYPNPFNPTTMIRFAIPAFDEARARRGGSSLVSLKVYDVVGREVATLVNEEVTAGVYEVEFDARELASGIYHYRLQANGFTETRKMILLR